MWMKRKALIMSAVIAMSAPFACADNVGVNDPPMQSGQNFQNMAAPRMDSINHGLFIKKEKSSSAINQAFRPAFNTAAPAMNQTINPATNGTTNGIINPQSGSKPSPVDVTSPASLHIGIAEPHRLLEYRLSEQGTIHFRLSRHRAITTAAWKF